LQSAESVMSRLSQVTYGDAEAYLVRARLVRSALSHHTAAQPQGHLSPCAPLRYTSPSLTSCTEHASLIKLKVLECNSHLHLLSEVQLAVMLHDFQEAVVGCRMPMLSDSKNVAQQS